MSRDVNRLLLCGRRGQAFLRAAGTWDAMPLTLGVADRSIGSEAQAAFWDSARHDSSMLVQIAHRAARADAATGLGARAGASPRRPRPGA
jgi:hypothetical protein